MFIQVVVVFCVIGLAVGQILFKVSSTSLMQTGSFFSIRTAVPLLVAMCIYAITSIVWVWVLQRIDLGRVYPLMALAFILVPIGSYVVFGERFQPQYFVGVALIMLGIVISIKA
jgi:drug/metabolite transporter (DMT)-like permease